MIYQHLFQPIHINGMELRNRICMTAMHLNYCTDTGGRPSPAFQNFYYQRAEGGAGLFTVGGCRFSPEGAVGKGFISLEDDSFVEPWQEFTREMHRRGAKVAVQLYHAGRYSRQARMPEGMYALAPSSIYCSYTHETAREMSEEDIRTVIAREAAAALRAKNAGFDAVEILSSAGYLISQFLSPLTNHRSDAYGGTPENRFRFARETLLAVREAVGPRFPILVRMAGNDFVSGSNTNEEAVQIARLYEACGADMLSVTGGWHETKIPQLPAEVPHGGFVYLAQAIKDAVGIPVIAANRIQDPALAEQILALGQADCIGMSRTLVADPAWPVKAMEHRESEIRPCVGCNQGCLSSAFFDKPVRCLVNGMCGREGTLPPSPAQQPKRILVVGGGPAGMEFAVRAAGRGHQITLWEQSSYLGGQLTLASVPPGKADFAALIPYYEVMLSKAGVQVKLGMEATADLIRQSGFDTVVLATGAVPKEVPITNPGKRPVYNVSQILSREIMPGWHVVIVGGGAVGCETAQYLGRQSAISPEELFFLTIHSAETPAKLHTLLNQCRRTLHIVELAPKLGSGFDAGCGWPVMKDLRRLGVGMYTNASIVHTTDHSAVISFQDRSGDAQQIEVPCDTILLCTGSLPKCGLYTALKSSGQEVHLLGDCRTPGRILDAVHSALDLASQI